MEKYKNSLKEFFKIFLLFIMLITFAFSTTVITNATKEPLDSTELMAHFEKLETIKRDFSKVTELEGIEANINDNGTVISIIGEEVELKAYFDKNNMYIRSDIIDTRAIKDFALMFLAFWGIMILAATFTFIIWGILLIPVYVASAINKIKAKKASRKTR